MRDLLFLAVCVAAISVLATFLISLRAGATARSAIADAARRGAFSFGCFLAGAAIIWSAEKMLIGMRALSTIHLAAATAIGLAVVGVYLSMGRTRWRSALCGAGTVACFLTVLALVHGAGV